MRRALDYLTLHADRDDFHVCVPLEAIKGQGIVVYKLGSAALGVEHGGPIRLIIRDPSACHTGELDDCANVKYLSRIELTEQRGRDTRPETEAEHAALHQAQCSRRHRENQRSKSIRTHRNLATSAPTACPKKASRNSTRAQSG